MYISRNYQAIIMVLCDVGMALHSVTTISGVDL